MTRIVYAQELSLETIWLSISAGHGPEECAHAAGLTLRLLQKEIEDQQDKDITLRIVEIEPSRIPGDIRSALLALEGDKARSFVGSWVGVMQWIWRSAYRPGHKRKNWFVSVKLYQEPAAGKLFFPADVRFETAKSGGPGGQHVNKTETAVRAVHIPSGKSTVARGERSQLMNKKLALARLAALFEEEQEKQAQSSRSALRHSHWELERGNPVRVCDGDTLKVLQEKQHNGEKQHG